MSNQNDEFWIPRFLVENGPRLNKSEFSKLSEQYVVGTLNLYLRMPDSLQKELTQSDHGGLRKRTKCVILAKIPNESYFSRFGHFLSPLWSE